MLAMTSATIRTFTIRTVLAIAIALPFAADAVKSRKQAQPPPPTIRAYDKAVNETLDTVMWIHERLTNERRKITWEQLNAEVCAHMNVKRTQPWERH
jgi:hypothetical protein